MDSQLHLIFEVLHRHSIRGDTLYCQVQFWPESVAAIATAALSSSSADIDNEVTGVSTASVRIPAIVTAQLHGTGASCREQLEQCGTTRERV